MANYIVGDIQGCYHGLMALLDKARFCQQGDTLWSVGDLIGRGAQAEQTLTYLHSLGENFKTVLGNHDLHFLAVSQGLRKSKSDDRFEGLLAAANSQVLINWLRQQPLARQFNKHTLICHAGLYPQWSF